MAKKKSQQWISALRSLVLDKPITILRFTDEEWWDISGSRRGTSHFTVARSHALLDGVRAPTVCIIFANKYGDDAKAYLALLRKRDPISTLETRVTIEHTHLISPSSEDGLIGLLTNQSLSSILRTRLADPAPVIRLSPKLSGHLIERLAEIENNQGVMQTLASSLEAPRTYSGNGSVQQDAINMALGAFGISSNEAARSVDLVGSDDTALARVSIREDAVIEHDARSIPPLTLAGSDLTGRAIFEHHGERLEVITANKRPLEQVLGVDLIYLNTIKRNIVMVQYKMLEPDRNDSETDWTYKPNKKFADEISRMKRFSQAKAPRPLEYRINPQVFYLKFIRRDATLGKSGIVIPIDHYEVLTKDPACKGPKGALRISYDTLAGRYLRQEPFLDLIRSGYIGAHAETTADLERLVNTILEDGRAVVAAVHSRIQQDFD